MGKERRKAKRVNVKLNARWEGVLVQRTGTLSDLSISGCFILTSDDVQPDELIRLEFQLPTKRWIAVWGIVVYQIPEMGFALRFTGADETEQKMLELLLESLDDKTIAEKLEEQKERRAKTRLYAPFEVTVEELDRDGQVTSREHTVTENISPRGAAVVTTLDIEIGHAVRLASVNNKISINAAVRARRTGKDGLTRLHLEFLDREWPLDGIE